jgi:geranylgeranylglycerol-phosphate geranylgeranyltransferase
MSQAVIIKNKTTQNVREETSVKQSAGLLTSQIVLFNYRKRWGLIYALATLTGLLCIPGSLPLGVTSQQHTVDFIVKAIVLPFSSFLIIVGMYVLNDLVDSNLDRINGKKRPIPTGLVTKKQAIMFILLTNVIGLILSLVTASQVGIIISTLLIIIGLMYSVPGIALKDRFLLKTLSIAFAMMLCLTLGAASTISSTSTNADARSTLIVIYAGIMLGSMVFITSPFNDIGDTDGDKKAGRRTIPIALGSRNTVKLAILISASIITVSWLTYPIAFNGWLTPTLVTIVSALAIITIGGTLNKLHDRQYVRKQHKRSMPLHLLIQSALIIGVLLL